MKRAIGLVISVLMVLCCFFAVPLSVSATGASGTFGDNITWTLSKDGVLTVSGEGAMPEETAPWREYYEEITRVIIDPGITTICDDAFVVCQSVKEFVLPDTLTVIGEGAFAKCFPDSIVIPDSVTEVKDQAFGKCYGVEITLSKNLKTIGDGAFHYCDITDLVVPDTVESIGAYAFSYCGIESVTIPKSVTYIGEGVLCGNSKLASITVAEDNAFYHVDNNCLVETNTKKLIAACAAGDISIPADGSVTGIGECAFEEYTDLLSVVIPDTVVSIGDFAFKDCESLKEIIIPESVESIGRGAFYGCENAGEITVPFSVTGIGDVAFY